ncbi:ketopantoate reductase family protein [Paenibacillus caui]|uniref:ketopantoate reductase family protein n=1 Tax=Paenibacillus caui TaxID=2873927 RepID=UPI001CA844FD|nr:ketopantoate reductase family protein [Paenibacillus caui]
MNNVKRISILGLGAIGCAYASKLYDMDPDAVQVIAGGERAERYKKEGFFINGKRYDFKYVNPEDEAEPADLIIVAVKANQLSQAIQDMRNHVGEGTIILSLLNGITSEEIIGGQYGLEKMLYSMCIGIDANREGNRVRFTSYGNITFGEKLNQDYSPRVLAVKDVFDRAGISYMIPDNMERTLWWKFMINVGINQSSAVLRGRYGVFQTDEHARKLMDSAMREVIRISGKAGVNLKEDDLEQWYKVLETMNPASRTSMLEDIESGRTTEVDIFAGTVCELGEKYGIETPVNRALFHIIKAMENLL